MTNKEVAVYLVWHPNGPFPAAIAEQVAELCRRDESDRVENPFLEERRMSTATATEARSENAERLHGLCRLLRDSNRPDNEAGESTQSHNYIAAVWDRLTSFVEELGDPELVDIVSLEKMVWHTRLNARRLRSLT